MGNKVFEIFFKELLQFDKEIIFSKEALDSLLKDPEVDPKIKGKFILEVFARNENTSDFKAYLTNNMLYSTKGEFTDIYLPEVNERLDFDARELEDFAKNKKVGLEWRTFVLELAYKNGFFKNSEKVLDFVTQVGLFDYVDKKNQIEKDFLTTIGKISAKRISGGFETLQSNAPS